MQQSGVYAYLTCTCKGGQLRKVSKGVPLSADNTVSNHLSRMKLHESMRFITEQCFKSQA